MTAVARSPRRLQRYLDPIAAEPNACTLVLMSCIFCQIVDGSIPSKAIYQDEHCYAFADIKPQAPVHILVVPRKHIASMAQAEKNQKELLGHLHWAAAEIARTKGLSQGYRTVINTGADGGQTVEHIHLHLLGGRPMAWPPG